METTTFRLQDFEGPLDLLLFLIKRAEINIYDIPIAEITEQYLEFLRYAERVELDNLTDFYLMAATLLYMKSQMLLPQEHDEVDEDWEDPRKDLVEQLIEYQKYKKLSELMEKRWEEAENSPLSWFERRNGQPRLPFDEEPVLEEMDPWNLFKVFSHLMSKLSAGRLIDLSEDVTTSEKQALLLELLSQKDEFPFTDLITRPHSLLDLICAFLSVLESSRLKLIRVFQNRLFGDIIIRKREEGT
ncbi:segregation and condensation protein A [Spirochaeta thermophila]|uniref:Segregation and condensation protein A n=1 Tax=Winmispira thermophila (strain ATCC 49972 / DSM 6192 / RI 19.B1) TaxID=665571 RepID=E0RSQ8_WINT6|nr:segregation/condensation protein A [Spirochaeta thermophila]ADN02045.1 segregation and condensation protein A [Spirochaeta thermophila DSM 6192]